MLLAALFASTTAHASCDAKVPAGFPTIQAAIDASADGDTICVAPGTWVENLVVANRILSIEGAGADRTVIDGGGVNHTVSSSDSTLTLSNLTVSHGYTATVGGGVESIDGALTLSGVDVVDNTAGEDGGGIYGNTMVVLDDVRILRNTAGWSGGGIAVVDGTLTGSRATIGVNTAQASGGGLLAASVDLDLADSFLLGNSADHGGGFMMSDASGGLTASVVAGNHARLDGGGGRIYGFWDCALVNVALVGNSATDGAGLRVATVAGGGTATILDTAIIGGTAANLNVGGVLIDAGSSVAFAYDDFWGNSGLDVSASQPNPVGVDGTIAADPAFVDTLGANWRSWDLHLQPGSPLVDAGDPTLSDLDGSRSDIGAYGGPLALP